MKSLLIIAPYPRGKAPSQRFRFEQYIPYLEAHGVQVRMASFWADRHWPAIYRKGNLGLKIYATALGFIRRALLLFAVRRYHTVLIHREATPIGPAWWEAIATGMLGARVVYDFDDAVWLPNNSRANEKLIARFKAHGKTASIIGRSAVVTAGNGFLKSYAARFCESVTILPTTIDTTALHNRTKKHSPADPPVIGWTGTHSTLRQLAPLFPLLEKLHETHPFRLLVISDLPPDAMPAFAEFRPWKAETEIEDLLRMDIGIMPLYDTEWERGKCGFKALQYMALGIPAVVSDVGVNPTIVLHGATGYVCDAMPAVSPETWTECLVRLLGDHHLRAALGARGREHVVQSYSVEAWKDVYGEIFGI